MERNALDKQESCNLNSIVVSHFCEQIHQIGVRDPFRIVNPLFTKNGVCFVHKGLFRDQYGCLQAKGCQSCRFEKSAWFGFKSPRAQLMLEPFGS